MRNLLIKRKLNLSLILLSILILLDYFIFSFTNWELNIADWSFKARIGFILILCAGILIISLAIWANFSENLDDLKKDKFRMITEVKDIYEAGGENFPIQFEEWYTDKNYWLIFNR